MLTLVAVAPSLKRKRVWLMVGPEPQNHSSEISIAERIWATLFKTVVVGLL